MNNPTDQASDQSKTPTDVTPELKKGNLMVDERGCVWEFDGIGFVHRRDLEEPDDFNI